MYLTIFFKILFPSQAVKYPKNSYIFLQDLLGKKINNPLVQQYKKRYSMETLREWNLVNQTMMLNYIVEKL